MEFEEWLAKVLSDPARLCCVLIGILAFASLSRLPQPWNFVAALMLLAPIEAIRRRPEVLRRRVVVPLPGPLEPLLGNVCGRCGGRVERGSLREAGGAWVCDGCYNAWRRAERRKIERKNPARIR